MDQKTLKHAIYKAYDGKCFYTGRPVAFNNMAIDHLVPRASGGQDEIENLVLTNTRFNIQKSSHISEDLLPRLQYAIKTVYAPRVRKYLKKGEKSQYAFMEFNAATNKFHQSETQTDIQECIEQAKQLASLSLALKIINPLPKQKEIFYRLGLLKLYGCGKCKPCAFANISIHPSEQNTFIAHFCSHWARYEHIPQKKPVKLITIKIQ